MKIDFEALRAAGFEVKLIHPDLGPDALTPPSFEQPVGVEIFGKDDGAARARVRKAVKEAFPLAPKTFVDDKVDEVLDELFAHTVARVCLEIEHREAEEETKPSPASSTAKVQL